MIGRGLWVVLLVAAVVLAVGLTPGLVIYIFKGKALDPSVKSVSQARRAIKRAQELVYQKTGIWVNNYLQLKAYLKQNGLIPLNKLGNQYTEDFPYNKEEHKPLADYCRENKIPTPAYGPDINFFAEDDYCLDVTGMAKRLLAMHAVSVTVQAFATQGDIKQAKTISQTIINKKDLEGALTQEEKEFLSSPTQERAIKLSWQSESCFTLAWALGISEEISPFYHLTGKEMGIQLEHLLSYKNADEIVANVKLRSEKELKFWANVYYCCLWAVRQKKYDGKTKLPKNLEIETVEDRYLPLAWILSNASDEGEEPSRYDWDDTPLDT